MIDADVGSEVIPVEVILSNGEKRPAEFHVWDPNPDNPADIRMSFAFSNFKVTVTGTNYFALMMAIRTIMEPTHALLNCYGASRNVQPSPMPFLVDKGRTAFRLKLGEQAQTKSVVSIFATGKDVDPVTVAEQEAFFEQWKQSIR